MSDESDVLAANRAFYLAFRREDPAAMDAVWAKHEPVTCIHPGWDALRGREDVMESWRAIFAGGGAPELDVEDETVHLVGEGVAFVLCTERAASAPGALIATNIFRRENDVWRMCHHQAGPVARQVAEPAAAPAKKSPPRSGGGGRTLN